VVAISEYEQADTLTAILSPRTMTIPFPRKLALCSQERGLGVRRTSLCPKRRVQTNSPRGCFAILCFDTNPIKATIGALEWPQSCSDNPGIPADISAAVPSNVMTLNDLEHERGPR
jgi:hypothetical protein